MFKKQTNITVFIRKDAVDLPSKPTLDLNLKGQIRKFKQI